MKNVLANTSPISKTANRFPYYQFTIDLPDLKDCLTIFKSFEIKGIAAAIVFDEDNLLPWSVWKEGMEHLGKNNAAKFNRAKKREQDGQVFHTPNSIPINGIIWLDCHGFADYLEGWGQGFHRGGRPKSLTAQEQIDAKLKYDNGMSIKELCAIYSCNKNTMSMYVKGSSRVAA